MKRIALTALIAAACCLSAQAQIRLPAYDSRINPQLLDSWSGPQVYNNDRWSASWITSPDADAEYGVYFFRKDLALTAVPQQFVIHVSADNRYKLYVNGVQVAHGPAKGDVRNWSFDTVDIAPWLKQGDNVVAAVVWNFASERPVAVMSLGRAGFLVQGNTEAESALNTNREWKVLRSDAYSPEPVSVRGYYAAGATDRVDAGRYPWGWQMAGFDDSGWAAARSITRAAMKGAGDYSYWSLVPRPIPPMELKPVDMARDLDGNIIPAGKTVEFLIDNTELTTGYPRLYFSGGDGAEITLSYAEALYEPDGPDTAKGDRNVTDGKVFIGYNDVILADGGSERSFEPLWWRTWRYLKLTVRGGSKPLRIDSLRAVSSMYPFTLESTFTAPEDPSLDKMLEIGWRTARLCAHETYMDCPYYEQLQYFGDARIQALVTMFNTRDTCMVRNLLEQGRQSMTADGLTMSRYPSHLAQDIAPYALFWLNTCHDWWMYQGDEAYLETLLPAMRSVISWFGQFLGPDNLLHRLPTWNFADWAEFANGSFPIDAQGRSAYLDLIYILALKDAAEMEDAFGNPLLAEGYRSTAWKITAAARAAYWSSERKMFADNGNLDTFSQHINTLAILADLVTGADSSELMLRTLNDSSLRACTIYFRYYLQRAMSQSGNGDLLLGNLDILRDQIALGLTTWAEKSEPSRSDCHAWGSSPNVEFFRTVLGIDAAAPGFRKVRIAPCLGPLKQVSGSMPHPAGTVSASYKITAGGRLEATITLPDGIDGIFVWEGRSEKLHPGENRLSL